MTALLEIENLVAGYGSARVLKGISLSVNTSLAWYGHGPDALSSPART